MELTTHVTDEERRVKRETVMGAIQIAMQKCGQSGKLVPTDDETKKNPTTRFCERLAAEHASFVANSHKFDMDLTAILPFPVALILTRMLGVSQVSGLIKTPFMRMRLAFYGSEMAFPAYVGYLHPDAME